MDSDPTWGEVYAGWNPQGNEGLAAAAERLTPMACVCAWCVEDGNNNVAATTNVTVPQGLKNAGVTYPACEAHAATWRRQGAKVAAR